MNIKRLTTLEAKSFLSEKSVILLFLCIAIASAYAVYQGTKTAAIQSQVVADTPRMQKEHTSQDAQGT